MKYNEKPQGEKKSSRLAALITAIILLCLVLVGGAFVLSGRPSSRGADLNKGDLSSSSGSGGEDRGFAGRLYDWLGIKTIMTILHPEESGVIAGGIDSADSAAGVKASVDESAAVGKTDLLSSADAAAGSDSDTADSAEVKAADADQADAGSTQSKAADADQADAGSTQSKAADADQAAAGSTDNKAADTDQAADQAAAGSTDNKAADTAKDSAANTKDEADKNAKKNSGAQSKDEEKSESVSKDEKDASSGDKKPKDSLTKLQKKYVKAWEEWHMRDFPLNFPLHNYNWKYLKFDDKGVLHYEGDENYTIRRGIDVSEFQGKIDWEKVKKAGYDFVFVRAGHRTMHSGDLQKDKRAVKNLQRAKKAGLDVGVYIFSQAITEKEARKEAELCLDVIEESGVEITLPIVYDPEIVVEDYYARINYISGEQFTDNTVAFCEKIRKAGFTPAIYANCSTETDILDMSRIKDTVIWYADYGSTPESPYDFTFWQYSNLGWVDGIPETETDLNVWFIKK